MKYIFIILICISIASADILSLINQARTDPVSFANNFLPSFSGQFSESALQDAISDMNSRPPVGSLSQCDCLQSSAQAHSDDMSANDNLSHTGSDGTSPFDRMDAFCGGAGQSSQAENIAMSSTPDDSQFVAMWIIDENIPGAGHRVNIMNGVYKFIGIGQSGNYVTTDFSSNC